VYNNISDDEKWMVSFAFGKNDDPHSENHMVIGLPAIGYNVRYALIIAVSVDEIKNTGDLLADILSIFMEGDDDN
jgi:hypothetical protein